VRADVHARAPLQGGEERRGDASADPPGHAVQRPPAAVLAGR
jgi:hypothetical protein